MPDAHTPPPDDARVHAFENLEFLRSVDARILRVLAELIEPQYRLRRHGIADTIVFFGSARAPSPETASELPLVAELAPYYEHARELARRMTIWSDRRSSDRRFVVCSGGGPGIMEAVNRGAADAGGESIGFGIDIPQEPNTNAYVTPDLAFVFHYFFMRKFWFVYNAKALVFFPGGFGTMDELMEILTLVQTGRVHKKVGIVLYGSAFWRSVLNFDALVSHGVIAPADLDLFQLIDSVDEAELALRSFLDEHYGPSLLEEALDGQEPRADDETLDGQQA